MNPKPHTFRDKTYGEHLKRNACMVTFFPGSDSEAIDPAHFGSGGKGLKAHDFYQIGLRHSLHTRQHQIGELTFWLGRLSEDPALLREVMRSWALVKYLKWRTGSASDQELVENVIRERDAA